MRVAVVQDQVVQLGGAERVVISMLKAYPDATLWTSVFDANASHDGFAEATIRTSWLNRLPAFRKHPRWALPLLAPTFSAMDIDADVVICSSAGWSHGVKTTGRKIVYCHAPARWLYQAERYLRGSSKIMRAASKATRPFLLRWDQRSAAAADLYLTHSRHTRDQIRQVYGIDALLLPPAPTIDPTGSQEVLEGIEPGFFLAVSRITYHKNVDIVVDAFRGSDRRLVVAGEGPDFSAIKELAAPNVIFLGRVPEADLRWLYTNCAALITASHEDFGLTPLEAALFGKPTVALRFGGFLDTIIEGKTGVFFDNPRQGEITTAVEEAASVDWDEHLVRGHAERYNEDRFIAGLKSAIERGEVSAEHSVDVKPSRPSY